MIQKGREYWKKVNKLQKRIMIQMKWEQVIEVRPNAEVIILSEGQPYLIKPNGETIRYDPQSLPQTVPYIPNPKYEKAMNEIAQWFVKHRRDMTLKDMRPIARKHFPTNEEADAFYNYLAGEGGEEFSKLLRLHGWKAGAAGPFLLPDLIPRTSAESPQHGAYAPQARGSDELMFGSYRVPPSAY